MSTEECTVCRKPLNNRSTRHYHEHCRQPELKPFKCNRCERTFASKSHLAFHAETHLERRLPCPDCDKTYKHRRDLDLHRRCEHETTTTPGEETIRCGKCSKQFPSQQALERHRKSHADDGLRPFKCDQCKLSFRLKGNLTKHAKILHSKQKLFKCERCSKSFYRNNALKFHMLSHQSKNFQCRSCEKEFVDARNLERHLKTHVTQKEYRCDKCGITSSRKDNILRHARSFHPESDLDKVILRGDLGDQLEVIKKDVQQGNKTKKTEPKPVEPISNRISVIQTVGTPKPLEPPRASTSQMPPKVDQQPKPIPKVDPLEIYRKILKPSCNGDDDHETNNVTAKSEPTNNAVSSDEHAPTPSTPKTLSTTTNTASGNNYSSINNFSEVHWRKRTSQIFTNSTR
ncbi:zinc finger protein 90 [Culex pipiens pallens]|uniref:zinc finger protein 90 n=1 Tax=Culex pipiens pallens TaxID=42434 RepID=UPI001952FDDC|nr:zinc finger protein 90 [Culex pipiens pallens]